jgi:acetyl-CoA C-acetyltransferase
MPTAHRFRHEHATFQEGTMSGRADDVVLLGAARTPIGKFQGALASIPAHQLAAVTIREAMRRAGTDSGDVSEVILGNVVQAGEGQAPARQAAIAAGFPPSVGAVTVNKVCGSGLKAVMMAASAVKAGEGDLFIAGGMENMNLAPYLLPLARSGYRLGNGELVDAVVHDGLWCPFERAHDGMLAEWLAATYGVSREEQDRYALESHRRAAGAIAAGRFRAEIVAVPVPQKKGGPVFFDTDEAPRPDTSAEALAALKPAFAPDGTVTAGNAPGITDGAASVVVARSEWAKERGLRPLARILGYTQVAVAPREIFTAPVHAVRRLSRQVGLPPGSFDRVELNEAFAAQAVYNIRELALDTDRVNVNGGAIALGHPIGASGARILTTLLYALQASGGVTGLAALCLGGGEAVAMAVELVSVDLAWPSP